MSQKRLKQLMARKSELERAAAENGFAPLMSPEQFKKVTGVNIRSEQQAAKPLNDFLGVARADEFAAHESKGKYHRLIQNFVDLACVDHPNRKHELKQSITDYIIAQTNIKNPDKAGYAYHTAKFLSVGDHYHEHRDQSYIQLGQFIAEMRVMADYIQQGYGELEDNISAAKARNASEFVGLLEKLYNAMESNGGISKEARATAEKVQASIMPAIIANCPSPKQAAQKLIPEPAPTHSEKESARREERQRPAIDTTELREAFKTLRNGLDKNLKNWMKLWKKYGANTDRIIVNGESPNIMENGLKTLDKLIKALGDPNKQLDDTELAIFAENLIKFSDSTDIMNEHHDAMEPSEREQTAAIAGRFQAAIELSIALSDQVDEIKKLQQQTEIG